ncbi:MAG: alpha/beta hydrolase [Leptospirales bacterium]|nr:alpha/beta hydrolase [Leptospirales bacterium]
MSIKSKIASMVLLIIIALIAASLVFILATKKDASFMARVAEIYLRIGGWKKAFESAENAQVYMSSLDNNAAVVPPKVNSKLSEEFILKKQVFVFNEDNASDTAVVYLHGGAYVTGPRIFHWNFTDKLSRELALPLYLPIYEKAPGHHYDEAYTFLSEFWKNLKARGIKRIFLIGDSAGGGLVLGFTQFCIKESLPLPVALILISPWLDLSMTNPDIPEYESVDPMLSASGLAEMGRAWAGSADVSSYKLSPINGSLEKIPPILLFVGTREIFLPDARRFKALAETAGADLRYVETSGMNHAFPLFPIPEGQEALSLIVQYIGDKK